MKAIKCVLVLAAVMMPMTGLLAAENETARKKINQEIIVQSNNKFALELYAKLRNREGNLFFSPYSISTALAMTYAGARGQTESQMAKVLGFADIVNPGAELSATPVQDRQRFASVFGKIIKDLNERGKKGRYQMSVANALWGQKEYGFLEEYLELIETNYGGRLNEVDFVRATEAARKTINTWVEKKTNNKIKELIKPGVLDAMTRLVLTNAIYFKGNWARQFDKARTAKAPFWPEGIDKSKLPPMVDTMNQTAEFGYMETDTFQELELSYVDDELSMIILLPKEYTGLTEFEQTLNLQNLSQWLAKLRKRKVVVSIPKFKATSQFSLASVLTSMGMKDAFSSSADFSGINGKRDLFISAVVHKAYVDVNEEGTEAAAATGVAMRLTSVGPMQTPVFRADHPFLFVIRDNHTGSILFIGRLMNPNA